MTSSLTQEKKRLVWGYWREMERARKAEKLVHTLHPDAIWHGFQPLRRMKGSSEILARFWEPLLFAIPDLIRRPYFFIGGHFEGRDWVCGTGDYIGTFARDWQIDHVRVPATGSSVHFRFGEFCTVQDGQIGEIRMIIDLPDLIRRAGIQLFPPKYACDLWIPGPLSGDAVHLEPPDPAESAKSLKLVEEMIFGGLNKFDGKSQESQGLERFWHPHMVWHGPVGIGTAYGLGEFKMDAQRAIVRAFPDRKGVGHLARIAEGQFVASTGWPSLVGTHKKDYLGWPATGQTIGWNIMDFWSRDGDLLLENWVLIDLIGAALQSGVDLLAEVT